MHQIHNERVKLTAGAINTLAIALVVTGLVVPFVNAVYAGTAPQVGRYWWLIGIAWALAAGILHISARVLLGGLRA